MIPDNAEAKKPFPPAAGIILVVALVLAACGGPRPNLTTDRLPSPTATPGVVVGDESAATAGGTDSTEGEPVEAAPALPADGIERLTVEVIERYPHDSRAWTQGLEIDIDGETFIEGTGETGKSQVRKVDIESGDVLLSVDTPRESYGEGVTRVADELIQLTWRDQVAFVWDADTLEPLREYSYSGEGWGLCYDGDRLIMTDGTPFLIFRDEANFDEIGRVEVTRDGAPVANLNEVECVDGVVWANIWLTDEIVRIDPETGLVNAVVDASLLEQPRGDSVDVLNGIAYDELDETFLLTGKLWPSMYRVNFVPADS